MTTFAETKAKAQKKQLNTSGILVHGQVISYEVEERPFRKKDENGKKTDEMDRMYIETAKLNCGKQIVSVEVILEDEQSAIQAVQNPTFEEGQTLTLRALDFGVQTLKRHSNDKYGQLMMTVKSFDIMDVQIVGKTDVKTAKAA